MWKDVVFIIGTLFTVLTYFGVTHRRLRGYVRTAEVKFTKQSRYQKTCLVVAIVVSGCTVYALLHNFRKLPIELVLIWIVLLLLIWATFLIDVYQVSGKIEKAVYAVMFPVALPMYIVFVILIDMPWWKKVVYPLVIAAFRWFGEIAIRHIREKRKH